jgi:PS-10 peptidase S37
MKSQGPEHMRVAPADGHHKKEIRAAGLAFLSLITLALLAFFYSCSEKAAAPATTPTLLDKLRQIPGFQVDEIFPPVQGFAGTFQILFSQPIDHQDEGRGTFHQLFFLSDRAPDRPMVFYTSGYGTPADNYVSELAALVDGNQIVMGHRFFSDNIPQDWKYLTIRQAADDQHAIREALKNIYPGKWLNTGASKGGMASLYYRRFYPDDVTATVAYVAPIMGFPDDPRFAPFFQQVGSPECRQQLLEFQRLALSRRVQLLPLFRQYAQGKGYIFTIIPEEAAFEYTVLEYPFAFWQYGKESDCANIPNAGATDQQTLDHLVATSSPVYYCDTGFSNYQPLFYQAYTEIGYCPYICDHLKDLLRTVPAPTYRSFAPMGVELIFRPEVMQDVIPWLRTQGERIIYIYGGIDPWSAAALEPAPGLDALKLVQPGANHSVKIRDLDQKNSVIQTLERWLGIKINVSALETWQAPPERDRL